MKTGRLLFFILIFLFGIHTMMNAQPYSDDFYPETTIQSPWTFYNPVGDATLTWTGTNAEIAVPSGTGHDLYTGVDNLAPRMLQPAPNTDFQTEVKFESVPSSTYQLQGIIVQEDNDTFIRFGSYYGNGPKLYVAVIDGSSKIQTPTVTTITASPAYLRVSRTGDNWVYEISDDGSSWAMAASFTQAFTVNQVGFYAGNAGGNPAFTASADYFMNTADPITDSDTQGMTPPEIEIWYGDTQTFGNLGNPQQWVNILGRVSDDNGIGSLTYTLNGGSSVALEIGPNGTRLVGNGDFVTEIDHADLVDGANTVEFTATDALGAQTTKTVTLNYDAGNVWTTPYTADFTSLNNINEINNFANIVDGLWELTADGIRTTETGYDRLIVMGDETWTTNYEATAEFIIHSASSGSGVGFAIGWQGHTGTSSPRTNWPLEAIGWVRNFGSSPSLRILTYTTGIEAQTAVSMSADTKYLLKSRSEDIGGGISRFSVKIWAEGTNEPSAYMLTADIADREGSVLLITHKADVTWGSVQIDPITGNQLPQFTSSPVTAAQINQNYTYNITASDPNSSDVLTITAPTLPGWLTFNDAGNGSATLSGTPLAGNAGSNSVELLVEDGNGGSATQSFSILVTNGSAAGPVSDQFCSSEIDPFWTIIDPYDTGSGTQTGESAFGINNGSLEISIPGSEGTHDLAQNLAPRLMQTVADGDFGVEVKFNSAPSEQYQMQGIVVHTSGGGRLRFETYYGTEPYFYANAYGESFGTSAVNQAIGGAIPEYLRLTRTGNSYEFDFSYDGTSWTNVVTTSINAVVTEVGFYGANHTPNPAFTLSVDYFRNIEDAVPICGGFLQLVSPNGGEYLEGGGTHNITWASLDITNLDIEFSSDNGSSWIVVAEDVDAANQSYTFTVPDINSSDCLIKLTDSDNSSLFDVSAGNFAVTSVGVEPTLTIGSVATAAGSYVSVPVDLTVSSGFKAGYLLQGKVHYDVSKLKFKYGNYTAGTLTNDFGWTGAFYITSPGTIDIILTGPNPINNSGTLFYLNFQVIESASGSAELASSSAEWLVDVVETPLVVENGTVSYTSHSGPSTNRGDATLNFTVDFEDALAVVYHWIDLYPLTGQAFTNADVDSDGDVDIDDYMKIIFFVYLNTWDFTMPDINSGSSVSLDNASIENNELVRIPVELTSASNVHSMELQLQYDSAEFEFINVSSSLPEKAELEVAENGGKLTMLAADAEQLQNGNVVTLNFKKLNSGSSSTMSAVYKLNNDKLSGSKVLSIGNGFVTSVEEDNNNLPESFELSQNYPNPFNPSTVINYSVPADGYYRLTVYNILGQKVAALVDGNLKAGYHSVDFNASGLTSGLYIYSLEGNHSKLARKMHLIK